MENYIVFFTVASFFTPALSAFCLLLSFKKLESRIYKISIAFTYLAVLLSFVSFALFFKNSLDIYLFQNSLISVYITTLTVLVMLFVSLVSLVIHLYSVKYMYDEEGYTRYFILLDLMIFVIFGLAVSGNILVIAFFWHMMGLILYFMLIHNFKKRQTIKYGFYTFFTHLLADIPLFIAVYLIYYFYQTTDLKLFLDMLPHNLYHVSFLGIETSIVSVIAILIMISALIKSAGFPLHIWLPYTLEGPNPVSALMHAGIVNAGAFIVNRFAPLYIHGGVALHVALVIGFITAILGSSLMLMQNDIKKALAYSTVGQMGYMMLEIGSGAFALAIYHMMVHGIFKASLFLGSGGIIHEARNGSNITDRSIFDFFFSKANYKKPSAVEYIIWVILAPMAIALVIFYPMIKENSYDSTLVFYLFAWVSGSQAIYTLYHTHKRFKAIFLTTIGFAFALLVYLFMEHVFGGFLYSDKNFVKNIYISASWGDAKFFAIYSIISAVVLLSWLLSYQKLIHHKFIFLKFGSLYDTVFKVLDREFYILDITSYISKRLITLSDKINKALSYSDTKFVPLGLFTLFIILSYLRIYSDFIEFFCFLIIPLYSFRLISAISLKFFLLCLYPILFSLLCLWYLESGISFTVLAALIAVILGLLSLFYIISSQFKIIHKKSISGIGSVMPRFSLLFMLNSFFITIFFSFFSYEIIKMQNFQYPGIFLSVFTLSWIFLNWGMIRLFEWFIFGKPQINKKYIDINNTQMSLLVLLMSAALLFAIGGAV